MNTDTSANMTAPTAGTPPVGSVARGLATAAVGVLLVCAILGVSFSLLLTPPPTWVATNLFSEEQGTGLTHEECAQVGQNVLAFSMGFDDASLPWGARETPTTLGEQSRTHLLSVRSFFLGMVAFGTMTAVAAAAALLAMRRAWGKPCVGRALMAGGIGALALAVVFTALALVDFDALFNWFHGWFFSSGSWLFPYDCLLIRSLPDPLWMFLGALLAILILAFSVGCIVAGRRLRPRAEKDARSFSPSL